MPPPVKGQPGCAPTDWGTPATRKQPRQPLRQFMTDDDQEVREAAADMAAALRGQHFGRTRRQLKALIASPSFSHALPQLLITLRDAPDRIDDLVVQSTERFLELMAPRRATSSTAAAGHAPEIGRLVLRAYTQASAPLHERPPSTS